MKRTLYLSFVMLTLSCSSSSGGGNPSEPPADAADSTNAEGDTTPPIDAPPAPIDEGPDAAIEDVPEDVAVPEDPGAPDDTTDEGAPDEGEDTPEPPEDIEGEVTPEIVEDVGEDAPEDIDEDTPEPEDASEPDADDDTGPTEDTAAPPTTELTCTGGVDDDDDGLVDCDDPDCVLTEACSPVCAPLTALACGASITSANDAPGSTTSFSAYSCNSYLYTGPEIAWTFTVDAPTFVTVALTKEGDDTDVLVIEDQGAACFAESCVDYGLTDALFLAQPGKSYSIIVDGYEGAVGAFTLGVACEACVPDCAGLACGEDGCGGSCGGCAEGTHCAADQSACVTPPPGDTCSAPTPIAALPFTDLADTSDALDTWDALGDGCLSTGTGGGLDVVYSFTPTSTDIFRLSLTELGFDASLYVIGDCNDAEGSCIAGADSPGNDVIEVGLQAGKPVFIVVDGTDESELGQFMLNVKSLGPCTPTCAGCDQPDGCGGKCPCLGVANDTCATAAVIDDTALPATFTGSTVEAVDNYSVPKGACPGAPGYGFGGEGGDAVYSLTPTTSGVYELSLDGSDYDAALYVVKDCAALATSCVGGDETIELGGELVFATLEAGQTVFVIVDGWSDDQGSYTLTVDHCVASCDGKACGTDGCGGGCGSCGDGLACAAGQCVVPTASCAGKCGEASVELLCQCDDLCFDFEDCCDDVCTVCKADFAEICDCVPDCTGKTCGDDGCFGSCGGCQGDDYCFEGQCTALGCGGVTLEGCCKGSKLLYCSDDELVSYVCGNDIGACGWDAQNAYYDCGFSGADPSGAFPIECP